MSHYYLTVSCISKPGIVGAIGVFLAENFCNIYDSSQFDDLDNGLFFMRVCFKAEQEMSVDRLTKNFLNITQKFQMSFKFFDGDHRTKMVIMVSKFGHCLNDLLYRWRIGVLPIDIVGVIANCKDHEKVVLDHGIPYHYIYVDKENQKLAEARQMRIIRDNNVQLVALARYMRILSPEMCAEMAGKIINIHHSFLPSFMGAQPYRQAYMRGVKIIGATSHYVTPSLDEGPIIEQDIIRVTHNQSIGDYIALGRDVENMVFFRAIMAHVQHRVFINGAKTVVFPPSPGAFSPKEFSANA